jgi:hypothetical protein
MPALAWPKAVQLSCCLKTAFMLQQQAPGLLKQLQTLTVLPSLF